MDKEKIRLLLVHNHVIFRKALTRMLTERMSNLDIVGYASYGKDTLELLRTIKCDLVLLHMSLPDMSGLAVVSNAKQEGIEVKFLIISGGSERYYVMRSLEVGARGYILADNPSEIIEAISRVFDGEIYVSKFFDDE